MNVYEVRIQVSVEQQKPMFVSATAPIVINNWPSDTTIHSAQPFFVIHDGIQYVGEAVDGDTFMDFLSTLPH